MRKLKLQNKQIVVQACFVLFVFLLLVVPVFAETAVQKAQSGLNEATKCGFGSCDDSSVSQSGIMISIPGAIGKVVGVALSFIGALFMLLMIYGGILWMTARGNESEVTKAKDLISAAVIGLIIVLAAYAITSFVGTQLTSGN